ncbi:MAG TPA: RNA polymerase sigma factor [Thermoanaerobaculia bacterium]|nr:RNA polymerase sigma factor [Thermoanaerobaculia bacterium]
MRPVTACSDATFPDADGDLLGCGYRYAYSLSHDAAEAEDLLQDACLAILGSGGRWERSYLFATIRNRFIDRYRRNRRILFLSLDSGDDAAAGVVGENWRTGDVLLSGQLDRALAILRAEEREALFLAVVEGYTADEIGQLTSRPRGTILSLLHRAKAKLRNLLSSESTVQS